MLAQFSEFSFGFAFTHEYVNHHPDLVAAPELPSLVKEAQNGWDLKIGFSGHAKYFQFKLSEYMVREKALHWKVYNAPHYRVRITSPSQSGQHNLLKRLSDGGEEVHYVAPRFYEEEKFNELFLNDRIATTSLWAPLTQLPAINDEKQHYLTFTEYQEIPDWRSEPVQLDGKFKAEDHYATVGERREINEDFFRGLREKLLLVLQEEGSPDSADPRRGDSPEDLLRETHRLLTAHFGLRLVILTDARDSG